MASNYSHDESIVRRFLWSACCWALLAVTLTFFVALQLCWPKLIGSELLSVANLQPLSAHLALYGFVGNAVFCGVYYSAPRLCKTPMWSRAFSSLHFWGWQAMLAVGGATLLLGFRQGRALAEFEWPVDLALAALWLVFALNYFGTLLRRRERHLYISLWFYSAAIVAFGIFHVVGNLALPFSGMGSYPVFGGVQDVVVQRWYASGAGTFLLALPLLGMMYYFLPKATGRPVFSYRLAVVHLWSLVIVSTLAGSHPSHYAPLPEWASTMGLLFGALLLIPSWAGACNGLLSMRGARESLATEPALKFMAAALVLYGASALERSLFAFRWAHVQLGFTDWSADPSLGGALGWGSLMAFGVLYWVAPRVFQVPLHSRALCARQLWLAALGVLLSAVAAYAASIAQSGMLRALSPGGQLLYPEFQSAIERVQPLNLLRVVGSVLLLAGTLVGVYNLLRTWSARPSAYGLEQHEAEPLAADYPREVKPQPTLAAVLETAKKWEVYSTLWWHRRGERQPLRMAAWAAACVVATSLVQLAPAFMASSRPGAHAAISPYTPLELLGREIYVSEGCVQCHSQVARRLWAETKRYGMVSEASEFAYDYPAQWGTRRAGPDLARQGGRRSTHWLVQHLKDPSSVATGSKMPAYARLMEAPLELDSLPARMGALRTLGVPYSEADVEGALVAATDQAAALAEVYVAQNGDEPYLDSFGRPMDLDDRQGIALVAYLQRLGTDRFRVPAATPADDVTEMAQGGE